MYHVYRRQLRWSGHVSRMPWGRLPRKFLSSWVYSPRPSGGQVYRRGQGVEKAVKTIGLGVTEWPVVAADRVKWRALVRGYGEPCAYVLYMFVFVTHNRVNKRLD
jgi:hypothetical protein